MTSAPAKPSNSALSALLPFLRPHAWRGVEVFSYLGIKLAADLVVPWSAKALIDDVLPTKDLRRLAAWCALIGVTWLLGAFATYRRTVVSGTVAAAVLANLRAACLDKLHSLPLRTLKNASSGDLLATLLSDVENLHALIEYVLPALIFETSTLLLVTAFAVTLNGFLAAFVLCVAAPLFGVLYFRTNQRLALVSRALQDESGAFAGSVAEQLANQLIIKSFNLRGWARAESSQRLDGVRRGMVRAARLQAILSAGGDFVFHGVRFFVLAIGTVLVFHGRMTTGAVVAFFTLASGLIAPFITIADQFAELKRAAGSLERLRALLQKSSETDTGKLTLGPLKDSIVFENVTVRHAQLPAVRHISFAIPKGALVALVGPSGSGKSTLLGLLARLFDPDEGRVLFDGRDLREVRLSSLREQVALVPQNPYLFDVSVRDNVALGKLGAAPTEVEAALRTAALDVKNELRPAGLDTIVGEQGAKLSGGQAQRVAVARAFVRDASLLLLDEATASLDARAEAELLDAVERFRSRGKTVIFATHRATAAERADLTIALRDGRLIQVEQRGGAQRAQLA